MPTIAIKTWIYKYLDKIRKDIKEQRGVEQEPSLSDAIESLIIKSK